MPKVSEEHIEARRQQIVDAAVQCFARAGIHGTSLDDIRLAADLSRGAVYHYFKSKEDIIDALRERSIEEDQQLLEDIKEKNVDLPIWIRSLGKGMTRNLMAPGNIDTRVAMFLWAEALLNERVLQSQQELFKPWRETMPGMVRQSQRDGDVNSDLDVAAVLVRVSGINEGGLSQLPPDGHIVSLPKAAPLACPSLAAACAIVPRSRRTTRPSSGPPAHSMTVRVALGCARR